MDGKNYAQVLEALVSGKGARRANWLDSNCVIRVHADETVVLTPVDKTFAQLHLVEAQYVLEACAGNRGEALFPFKICLHTESNEFAHLNWVPRKKDIEAVDWIIVD